MPSCLRAGCKPACNQIRATSTCWDSSNMVADQFKPNSITLSSSQAGWRPARKLNSVKEFGRELPACKLDSVMEFGLQHAHAGLHPAREQADQLASRSMTNSRAGYRPAHELDSIMEFCLYCIDVAQWRLIKLCTMFGRLLCWYTIYTFLGAAAP